MTNTNVFPYHNWLIEVVFDPYEEGYWWQAGNGSTKLDSRKQPCYETPSEALLYAKREIDWMDDRHD